MSNSAFVDQVQRICSVARWCLGDDVVWQARRRVCVLVVDKAECRRVAERLRVQLRRAAGVVPRRATLRRANTTVRRVQRLPQCPRSSARLRARRLRRYQSRRAVFCCAAVSPTANRQDALRRLRRLRRRRSNQRQRSALIYVEQLRTHDCFSGRRTRCRGFSTEIQTSEDLKANNLQLVTLPGAWWRP